MNFATLHFDTYKVVNLLTERGYTKEQAEGFIQAVQEVSLSGVATKEDLNDVRKELNEDINELRNDLRQEIQNTFIHLNDKIEKGLSDNFKFQIIQTITIIGVMVALFSIVGLK